MDAYGTLQHDPRYPQQALWINALAFAYDGGTGVAFTTPLWLKVSVRAFDPVTCELAVQVYNDNYEGVQLGYGHAFIAGRPGLVEGPLTIGIAWDMSTQPVDPEGIVGWPLTQGTPVWELTLQQWESPGGLEPLTYFLEWWHVMINDVGSRLRQELQTAAFEETTGAGYPVPDAFLYLAGDDETEEEHAMEARFDSALVVVHSCRFQEAEPELRGGHGRDGHLVEARVTVFSRTAAGLDTTSGISGKDRAALYANYLARDLMEELQPSGGQPNLLGGYLAFSRTEQHLEPVRVPSLGSDVLASEFVFYAYKYEYASTGVSEVTGYGVEFNFNLPYIAGATGKLQNDHALYYNTVTSTWHLIGIRADIGQSGSANFSHYTSPDLRTWTEQSEITIGSGVADDWRNIVFAPFIIANPNYPGTGVDAYRWLMFFTGVSKNAGSDQLQKIGLAGSIDSDLETWTVLNSDAAIYWSGMATATYPLGAPWCDTATYESSWGGASRDPWIFTDGSDWYLALTAKQDGNTARQCVGLAKFAGGTTPDWTDLEHNATALWTPSSDGLYGESCSCQLINGRWHFTSIGSGGTRHQSSTSHPTTAPFNNSVSAGVVLNDQDPDTPGLANELMQVSGDTYVISGHVSEGTYYWYKLAQLDFDNMQSHADGEYPGERPLYKVPGLVGLNEGVLDLTLTWTQEDSEGTSSAFADQPVWGDQPAEGGESASGMTGSGFICTKYRANYPASSYNGTPYPDYTRVGWIKSASFEITRNRLEVYVAGMSDSANEFLALVEESTGKILWRVTGNDSPVLERHLLNVTSLRGGGRGTNVYLAVVDQGTTTGSYIALDLVREYEESGSDAQEPELPLADGPLLADLITI